MNKALLYLLLPLFVLTTTQAQTVIKGNITDAATRQPLEGVTIRLLPSKATGISDQLGNFIFRGVKERPSAISFSSIGFETRSVGIEALKKTGFRVALVAQQVELANVVVSSHAGEQYKPISRTDIAMRGVNNSQEVLRIIPGIVIGQHQGGGKAEQIFLRGF
ncbi:MAG TPA: carboxypeptidase-like regulatory domain-containing protein, partial [Chitinophagaceae bacterium]|nr:carboxypeptidase-like regulatory domain-containing protein [Chitinophagaceae bacterium]